MRRFFCKIWIWMRANFDAKVVEARVLCLERKIDALHAEVLVRNQELMEQQVRFDDIRKQLDLEMSNATRTLDSAKKEIKSLDEALDATREELRTARDIVIPGLVSANQVFIERWQAETAVQASRAAFSSPTREPE